MLTRLNATEHSLQPAVAMELARSQPETFGTATAHTPAQLEATRTKLVDLFARIEASWQRADLVFEPVVRNAENDVSRQSFAMTGGSIFLGDCNRVAEPWVKSGSA